MKNNDALFSKRPLGLEGLTVRGLWPAACADADVFVKREDSERESFVIPLPHGSAYEFRFPQKPGTLRAALCAADPRTLPDGGCMAAAAVPGP